jgi:hypothetical protein
MSKTALIFGALALVLAGCATESMDPYSLGNGNGGLGKLCTQWVMWEGTATEADSTSTCSDGTAPRLYYTQWLTALDECVIVHPTDVKGGIKGVRRVFGCKR